MGRGEDGDGFQMVDLKFQRAGGEGEGEEEEGEREGCEGKNGKENAFVSQENRCGTEQGVESSGESGVGLPGVV